jgi:predicted nucleic acid-binding protein
MRVPWLQYIHTGDPVIAVNNLIHGHNGNGVVYVYLRYPSGNNAAVAREWGRLVAAVVNRGGAPRRRALDLLIAATANVHNVPLVTRNAKDFRLIADLVET